MFSTSPSVSLFLAYFINSVDFLLVYIKGTHYHSPIMEVRNIIIFIENTYIVETEKIVALIYM